MVNLGVIYGAFLAGSTRRGQGWSQIPQETTPAPFLRHGIGGLLMGYGGFLSYGCNISSFLGGVMSFSLQAGCGSLQLSPDPPVGWDGSSGWGPRRMAGPVNGSGQL